MNKTFIVLYLHLIFLDNTEGFLSCTMSCAVIFPSFLFIINIFFDISGVAYFNRSTFLLGKITFSNAVLS